MRTMRAPYTAVLSTLAGSRSAGMKTHASKPCCAACAATALARFPVEEQPTVSRPKRRAAVRAVATTRSLKEREGKQTASFLKYRFFRPHVEGAGGEIFAARDFLERVVVVGNFEGREAVFTERTRDVAPGFAAFFTAQFVRDGHWVTFFTGQKTHRANAPCPVELPG